MAEAVVPTDVQGVSIAAPFPPPGDRRRRAARGVMINSFFFVCVGALNLLKSFVVARFLTASQYGVWSVLLLAVILVTTLKAAAVGEKYIQQDEPDQELAFQKAFTLELISAAMMALLFAALTPCLVLLYGRDELLLPGLAMSVMLFGLALQAPIWIFYRRMEYARQRLLMAVDPVLGFIVTVTLAAVGFGYWSLVLGVIAGAWAAGLVAVLASPYPLTLRYEGATMRQYVSFSWPLMTAVVAGLLIAQLSVLFGNLALGLAGAGAIGLAATYSAYTDKVDAVITEALYPAICRVVDRKDLLLEVFTKSNRLALMWGVPFGVGLTLFASDLIDFGIGRQWADALVLFQVFGLVAAVSHIGFNWTAFYRASGNTRPIAVVTVLALVIFTLTAIPLLFLYGLDGFAAGIAIMAAGSLCARAYYVLRLFPRFEVVAHTARAIAPTIPAVASVLALRLLAGPQRSLGNVAVELAAYVVVTIVATLAIEWPLLREAISYVRKQQRGLRTA